ncbi:MAG: hypothetical protein KDK36_13910, partial [Leptospiraceae bacterium]|nr:hypothetical protein [Leptospiraceae bacterium]
EVDYISIALGIALGLLLGEIPIPIPGGGNIKLGFAGGPLIVSLILGKIGRTGKFVWVISYNSNHTIRQLGVVLFLAGIGLKAGYSFGVNIEKYGLILFAAGAIITLFNTFLFMILARIIFKTPYPLIIGMTSGMQTQPACVAYANSEIKNSVPGYGYALVFPISMIAKILLGEFILKFLK